MDVNIWHLMDIMSYNKVNLFGKGSLISKKEKYTKFIKREYNQESDMKIITSLSKYIEIVTKKNRGNLENVRVSRLRI